MTTHVHMDLANVFLCNADCREKMLSSLYARVSYTNFKITARIGYHRCCCRSKYDFILQREDRIPQFVS